MAKSKRKAEASLEKINTLSKMIEQVQVKKKLTEIQSETSKSKTTKSSDKKHSTIRSLPGQAEINATPMPGTENSWVRHVTHIFLFCLAH